MFVHIGIACKYTEDDCMIVVCWTHGTGSLFHMIAVDSFQPVSCLCSPALTERLVSEGKGERAGESIIKDDDISVFRCVQ